MTAAFLPSFTIQGLPPTRQPAPKPLPSPDDVDGVLELTISAASNRDDRDTLAKHDDLLHAALRRAVAVEWDIREQDKELGELRVRVEALTKAHRREQEVALAHAQRAQDLLVLNEERCQDVVRARKAIREMSQVIADMGHELSIRDAEIDTLKRLRPVPPPVESFESSRIARGTNPENETIVVDVGGGR